MKKIQEGSGAQGMGKFMRGMGTRITLASEIIENQTGEIDALIEKLRLVRGIGKIFILGEGRSGIMGQAFAIRLMHCGFDVRVILKDTAVPRVRSNDVVIVISGSGETDVVNTKLRSIQEKTKGVYIILFSSNIQSTSAKYTNLKIRVPGRDDNLLVKDVEKPPLGSEFEINVLCVLESLIQILKLIYNISDQEMSDRHEI